MWDVQDLFRRYRSDLTRYLRRRGASPETAADLTQEAFLRLLTATPLRPIDNVRAYLFQTANNLSIDFARRQRLSPFVANGEDVLAEIVDEAPSPERIVLSRQELVILQAALNRVPQTHRRVFLARLDGKTFEEIGRQFGIPTATVFSQMVKVMMYLRAAMEFARR